MKSILLVLVLIISGCVTIANKDQISKIDIIPVALTVGHGESAFLSVNFDYPIVSDEVLVCDEREQPFFRTDKKLNAYISVGYFLESNSYQCFFKYANQTILIATITKEVRQYKSEQLRVNPKDIKLLPKDLERVLKEQERINEAYKVTSQSPLFFSDFMKPINTKITSFYGTARLFNKEKKSQHLGVDFRATIGSKVYATNSGVIKFSDDLFYTGNTVIIEHGAGVFSLYGHLSKLAVKEGDVVKKGALIGLSGNTGRSTGPHLHWGIKVSGNYINGIHLLSDNYFHYFEL